MLQIWSGNLDLSSGGVAWIIATASATGMFPPASPFMLITAFIHVANSKNSAPHRIFDCIENGPPAQELRKPRIASKLLI
jgi:poly(A) polymerase Pap1